MSRSNTASICKRIKTIKSGQPCVDAPEECAAMSKALLLPEILQMIFCHLDAQSKGRAAQVSWSWHDLIERPQSWRNVIIGLLYDETKPLECIMKPVKTVIIDEIKEMTVTQPSARSYPFVSELANFIKTMSTDKTTLLIVKQFKNLTSLRLGYVDKTVLSDASLTLIVAGLKSLRHLDLIGCRGVTDMGIACLSGWNGARSDGNCPTLHSLTILLNDNLTDEAIKYLSVGQTALRSLQLAVCSGITNAGLQFLPRLVDLRILRLCYCRTISEDGMFHLTHMPSLIEIDLSLNYVTAAGLKLLATGVPRLTSLTLFKCRLEDKCCVQLANFTHLSYLNLCQTNIEDSVLQCLTGSQTIDTICLSNCSNLTPEAGRHLARMRNLRDVDLSHTHIGDTGLGYLADAVYSRIEILILDGNEDITDVGLNHVNRLPRLQKFWRGKNSIRLPLS